MKTSFNKKFMLLVAVIAISVSGCKKYTEEQNLGGQTDEIYFVSKAGFEDLTKSNYPNLRYLVSNTNLYTLGTDIFTSSGVTDNNPLNIYNVSLNSSVAEVDNFWKQLYFSIGTTNTTLYWATLVQGMDAATLNARIGEAKALRAYYYYLLAETFGDVPLVLERSTTASVSFSRTAEKDVYAQIIKDLTEAISVLPATTTEPGRVTKGFAQHLLAKVYLTRGYKSYSPGALADFNQAASLAETLIGSGTYGLRPTFSSLFDPTVANFQINNEVIFSVQYSTNVATNQVSFLGKIQSTAVTGNNLHQSFIWDTQGVVVLGRSSFYNKPSNFNAPDPYFFSLFDKTRDSRYNATVWNGIVAQAAGTISGKTFAVGDTVIYYPDVAFTAAEKAAKKYFVFNPDEYRSSPFSGVTRTYPLFKKFRETGLTYADNNGTRDSYVFRLAETYLIASEANLQAGNTTKALTFLNAVRSRAAKTGNNPLTGISYATEMQLTTVSLDVILDERARELAGEEFRWLELKRTGKLLTRVLLYNEEAKASNTLKATHLLRPIPQSQIDLNRGAAFPQNLGY